MGLFFAEVAGPDFKLEEENATLHQLGCNACPLATEPGDMPATGPIDPLIYVLGEAPGREEIDEGRQFVGASGRLLRKFIPQEFISEIRWNNVVRSRPPGNRDPDRTEIECCRPSVLKDIERTKPKVIFGFGNVPLHWITGFHGIKSWRGRRMPVRVGTHTCWFYAFYHPAFLLYPTSTDEDERATAFDLERAFKEIDRLPVPIVHDAAKALSGVDCVTSIKQIEQALAWASRLPYVGVDYETNCLRPYEADSKVLSAAVATLDRAFAFPIEHPGSRYTAAQVAQVRDLWKQFLLRAPCAKVAHNLTFEMEWSAAKFGTETLRAQPWHDTATAASIIDERIGGKPKPGCFALEFLVQQYFGFNVKKVSNVDRTRLEHTPVNEVLSYNAIDAKYHAGMWGELWPAIKREKLESVYELSLRRVPTVVLSQLRGAPVDQERVRELQDKYGKLVKKTERAIDDLNIMDEYEEKRGKPYNPYSVPETIYVFERLLHRKEINVVDKFSKRETRSVKEEVLEQINHPLARHLLTLRSMSGTKSKYIDPLRDDDEDTVIFNDGLIHANFNTYGTVTGRLSSDDPNMQNFPKRDDETKEVRSSIVAPPGCVCLSFDYGQIEARVAAMFTKDERFVKMLWDRYDIHGDWAKRIAYAYPAVVGGKKNLNDKDALKKFRGDIKNCWTFPLIYGAKCSSVAGYLKVPENVISPLFDAFWREFGGILDWQRDLLKFYRRRGYVECLTGRRRHAPLSDNRVFNTPVQGTAAEIVMDAMCRLSETGDPELQPELQIHDDLTYLRVSTKRVDIIAEKVIDQMLKVQFPWAHLVPITIEMSVGPNWEEMEEVGTYASDTWRK